MDIYKENNTETHDNQATETKVKELCEETDTAWRSILLVQSRAKAHVLGQW